MVYTGYGSYLLRVQLIDATQALKHSCSYQEDLPQTFSTHIWRKSIMTDYYLF